MVPVRCRAGLPEKQGNVRNDFDWLCLADIFVKVGCPGAVIAATAAEYGGIVAELEIHRNVVNKPRFRMELCEEITHPRFLDFSNLDERVKLFYKKFKFTIRLRPI